jgi:hypothetical protein
LSFEIFAFQKIHDKLTRYQQIHIPVPNEWNLSFLLNQVLKQRGKEILKTCHLSQQNQLSFEEIRKQPRGKVIIDLLENKI